MKNIILLLLLLCTSASLSAQCLSFNTCEDSLQICDYSPNNNDYWSQPYWLDPQTGLTDLTDAIVDLSITGSDTCGANWDLIGYILYLDLDGDQTMETWISSENPPPAGTVLFNNPGFVGGTSRVFDGRPVTADQKYQFAIDTVQYGNTVTAYLRWNTPANPDVFVTPELPTGRHRIRWIFRNTTNEINCETFFELKDCKKPTVVCLNGLSVNVMPTGLVTMWASDFLQYMEDNATPTNLLELAIRRSNTGTGFPVDGNGDPNLSITFNCNELGTQSVEVWSKDLAGNADYCETYVIVQDNAGNCPGGGNNDAPVVICYNGLTVYLDANDMAVVSASTLLNAAYDDNTPSNLLDLGIRHSGTGTGFPVDGQGDPVQNLSFNINDLGVQSVEVWARDEDGNADYCETYVIIAEDPGSSGEAPTLVCLNGLSVNIMPTGLIQLWATDFLQYVEDDLTPSNQILLGIRKTGTGTGFPMDGQGNPISNVIFSCAEIGTQTIELWAKDHDGNASYCETYVLVQDNLNNCGGALNIDHTFCIRRWCDNAVVSNVTVSLTGGVPFAPPFSFFETDNYDANGCYHLDSMLNSVPVSADFTVTPVKDDQPNNGVTPLDLVKMTRHILGLEPLSTYAMIAADGNKSGTVTTFDIVESRKLIQGIYQELPNNTSWRFVDADFVFPNPANPFQTAFPETLSIDSSDMDAMGQSDFIAIKIGDVDCDATPGVVAPADDRQLSFLTLPDAVLGAGETMEVPVSFAANGAWLAMQAGLRFDPQMLEIVSIVPGNLPDMDKSAFAEPMPGVLNMVWFTVQPAPVRAGEKLFTLQLRARQPLQLSQALQLARSTAETPNQIQATGYDALETPFNFQLVFRGNETAGQTLVFEAQPNPTASAARIPIRLAQRETVRLMLTDISGKLIWEQQQLLSEGMQMLDIPATALSKSGVYLWHVQAGETIVGGKLVRI